MDELLAATSGETNDVVKSSPQADAFFSAIRQGKIRAISNLLEAGCDVNIRNESRRTPLMQAVYVQKDDVRTHIVRMLLGRACDVNLQDEDGRTALMMAAFESGRDDVVRRVVSTGKCDPNVRDMKGDTALIYAVYGGNASVIRILVNSSHTKGIISVDAVNNDRISPLKLAFKLRQDECVRVLVDEGRANASSIRDRDVLNAILGRGPGGGAAHHHHHHQTHRAATLRPDTGGLSRAHAVNSNTRPWADPFGDLLHATSTTYNPDTDIVDPADSGKKKVKRYKKKKSKRTAVVHPDNDSDELEPQPHHNLGPLGPLLMLNTAPAPSNTARATRTSYSQETARSTATPSGSMRLGAMDFRDVPGTSHSNYSTYSKTKRLTPLSAHADSAVSLAFTPRTSSRHPLSSNRAQFAATPISPEPAADLPHRALTTARTGSGVAAVPGGAGLLWWSTSDEYDVAVSTARDSHATDTNRTKVRRKKKPKSRLSPLHSGYRTPGSSRAFDDSHHGPTNGTILPAIPTTGRGKFSLIGSPDVYNNLNF